MNILILVNDPPYGADRSCNGLRLVAAVANEDVMVTDFLLDDGMLAADKVLAVYT